MFSFYSSHAQILPVVSHIESENNSNTDNSNMHNNSHSSNNSNMHTIVNTYNNSHSFSYNPYSMEDRSSIYLEYNDFPNSISENSIDENSISENSISENRIPENSIPENSVLFVSCINILIKSIWGLVILLMVIVIIILLFYLI